MVLHSVLSWCILDFPWLSHLKQKSATLTISPIIVSDSLLIINNFSDTIDGTHLHYLIRMELTIINHSLLIYIINFILSYPFHHLSGSFSQLAFACPRFHIFFFFLVLSFHFLFTLLPSLSLHLLFLFSLLPSSSFLLPPLLFSFSLLLLPFEILLSSSYLSSSLPSAMAWSSQSPSASMGSEKDRDR